MMQKNLTEGAHGLQDNSDKPDKMLDMLVVEKLQDIKLICSEKHNKILKLVVDRELSISDIARALSMNPGSVHYHLKELERHGLVKQVRQEIKGGIVKKYYRSSAKRILLDSPNFNLEDSFTLSGKDQIERLIRSIEFLGYQLPPENLEDAEELLSRFDKRLKEMLVEMQNTGLDNVETDGYVLQNAYHLILNIRAKDDPEMGRIYREFEKLFLRYK
jgi:DNA-binding transcriptional ArsR family regulator